MMSSRRGVVAFDVLGTCFGLEALVDALRAEFGDALRDPVQTALLWYYSAQRDFVYMHAMGDYVPIGQAFKATLARTVEMACENVKPRPKALDDPAALDRISAKLSQMTPRPGLIDAYNKLEQAGFEVWAVTNGGTENTLKLFTAASEANAQQLSLPIKDRILSCDKIQVAKPDARVYENLNKRAAVTSSEHRYFVAAHSWDLHGAAKAGWKTAWTSYEEHVALDGFFTAPDLSADSLLEIADAIIRDAEA